jgi:hypothetical protein
MMPPLLAERLFSRQGSLPTGASHFCSPHPKSLSQRGRGTLNLAPLLPFWEKGLGDEGKLANLRCTHCLPYTIFKVL